MDLRTLEKKLLQDEQELAIPVSDVWTLYTLQISDCTVTGDRITVQIRIPIRERNNQWSLYEMISVPFAWYNNTCRIQHESAYVAVSEGAQKRVKPISGVSLHHCRPFHDRLCFLPRFLADSFHGPSCIRKLTTTSTIEELGYHCPMTCYQSAALTITEIEDELYLLTHVNREVALQCSGRQKQVLEEFVGMPGAKKMKIPCHCELVAGGEILIAKRFPCTAKSDELDVLHVLPATWSSIQSLVVNDWETGKPITFRDLTQCLNENWTLTISHTNLTTAQERIKNVEREL